MTKKYAILSAVHAVPSERAALFFLIAFSSSLLVLEYVALVLPDATYVVLFLNDIFGLADAAYRTYWGQVPSIDFRSLYGAATWYPIAIGFHFGFNTGGAFAFGHLLTAASLLLFASLVSARRLAILPSTVLVLFLFLLIAVPVRLGGEYSDLTYGIYYTRHGWAAFAIALLLYLEPRTASRRGLAMDSVVLACLLLYLFYLKITFGAVAIAFAVLNGLTSRYKSRVAIGSFSIFLLVFAAIQIFTDYNSAYFRDILAVVDKTPAVRRGLGKLLWVASNHFDVFALCFTAWAAAYFAGRRRVIDFAFVTGCLLASLIILDQSGGTTRGIPGMVAVFLIFGELARRADSEHDQELVESALVRDVASVSIFGMLLAFAAAPIVVGSHAFLQHYLETATASRTGESLSGLYVPPVSDSQIHAIHEALGHDESAHQQLNELRIEVLDSTEYMRLVAEGVGLLTTVAQKNDAVVSFEPTNPFIALVKLRPTQLGKIFIWLTPQFSTRKGLPNSSETRDAPERFFSDADYVMVPEVPYNLPHHKRIMAAYGPYLAVHFEQVKRSSHWRLFARK